ncbi:MAG: hypothetical protein HY781_06550 [Chloroflexi bacterium]|nr:hypothetical protein [Chloroflexota bacterium]
MAAVIQFFADYVVLIYLLLLVAVLFAIRRFGRARREQREAVFGLEVELARRHHGQSVAALVSIGLLALAEFVLVVFLVPALPALLTLPTPTNNLAALPTSTIPPEIMATINAATPGATATTVASGCIPGQIMITSPKPGDQVRGKITLKGTADIPNFGFYKYEFALAGTDIWITIQAGRDAKQEADLGDWDTSELTAGDYLLRLVVTDNQGQALPACVIPIRVLKP